MQTSGLLNCLPIPTTLRIGLKLYYVALKYLKYITDNYPTKFDMNIRTLIHSINLRANNNGVISFGKENEMVWRLLIKKYLVKVK